RLRRNAIRMLVILAELEQKGAQVGIALHGDEVERRAKGVDPEGGGAKDAEKTDAPLLLARLGLIREKLFAYATRHVRISPAQVRAFYAAHRAVYRRYPQPLATVREQLLATARNRAAVR